MKLCNIFGLASIKNPIAFSTVRSGISNNLLDNDGNLKDIYTNEGLHLSDLGYFKVTTSLNKYINE